EPRLDPEGAPGPPLAGEAVAQRDTDRVALGCEPKLPTATSGLAGSHSRIVSTVGKAPAAIARRRGRSGENRLDQLPLRTVRPPDARARAGSSRRGRSLARRSRTTGRRPCTEPSS